MYITSRCESRAFELVCLNRQEQNEKSISRINTFVLSSGSLTDRIIDFCLQQFHKLIFVLSDTGLSLSKGHTQSICGKMKDAI